MEANLKTYLDWAFLEIGGFKNVTIPTSGFYGGNEHQLSLQNEPNYNSGQVWQGFRQDWVWETGLQYSSTQPINISGVYVDDVFYPTGTTGPYAFTLDYPRGRVVFDSPITPSTGVTLEYSYRTVQITNADAEWYKNLQFGSMRPDDPQFPQFGSGEWNNLQDTRLQLPTVIIDLQSDGDRNPYELGSYVQWVNQRCLFHVFAEEAWWNKQIRDILYKEDEHSIYLFDLNQVATSGAFALNAYGDRNPSGVMYPGLVAQQESGGYRWKLLRFCNTNLTDLGQIQNNFYGSVIRTELEILLP